MRWQSHDFEIGSSLLHFSSVSCALCLESIQTSTVYVFYFVCDVSNFIVDVVCPVCLMSQAFLSSQEDGRCPFSNCIFSGPSGRILDHLRQHHKPDEVPTSFITGYGLVQHPRCCHWFKRLQQHLSKCKASSSVSSCQPSASSQSPCQPLGDCITSGNNDDRLPVMAVSSDISPTVSKESAC